MIEHRTRHLMNLREADPIDRREVNVVLRQLLSGVVIDHEGGDRELHWRHGGQSYVTYQWRWG